MKVTMELDLECIRENQIYAFLNEIDSVVDAFFTLQCGSIDEMLEARYKQELEGMDEKQRELFLQGANAHANFVLSVTRQIYEKTKINKS